MFECLYDFLFRFGYIDNDVNEAFFAVGGILNFGYIIFNIILWCGACLTFLPTWAMCLITLCTLASIIFYVITICSYDDNDWNQMCIFWKLFCITSLMGIAAIVCVTIARVFKFIFYDIIMFFSNFSFKNWLNAIIEKEHKIEAEKEKETKKLMNEILAYKRCKF